MSLVRWNALDPVKRFIGLENWIELITDRVFLITLKNNFTLVILTIVVQIPIGLALAVLLDRGGKRFKAFKIVYFIPMVISPVAIGILFKYIYDPHLGLINTAFRVMRLDALTQNWLGNTHIAIYAVIAVVCWQYIPLYMVYFLAALTAIPEELHDAALIDGATERQYFWKIVLPLLKGAIRTAAVIALVGSLKYFDLIYVMTEGGPVHSTELMATYLYKNAFTAFRMGYGSTIAAAMFIIITATSILFFTITLKKEKE